MITQEILLARYSILHELGQGPIGRVYAARDRQTGEVLALKRLDPALVGKSDASFVEHFLTHARAARLLNHPNIGRVQEVGQAAGTVYVAMEMLEGESLRKMLDKELLPIARAMEIVREIASGLAHAHLQGVVHGDLKPSNIMVLRSGVVKITDFGTALLAHAAQLPAYMSPEQASGAPIDHRCDIFSLGALFYEMLAHRPPFEGASAKGVPRAAPPPPSELNPHIPRALDAIVLSMLAAQPAARMPGVPILLRDLQRLEEGLGVRSGVEARTEEPPPAPSVPPPEPERRFATPGIKRLRDREPMPDAPRLDPTADRDAFDYQNAIAVMDRESRRERSSSGSRRGMFMVLAFVVAVLGAGVAGYLYQSSPVGRPGILASHLPEAPATKREVSRPSAPPPMATATVKPAPVVDVTREPTPVAKVAEKPAPVAQANEKAAIAPAAPPPTTSPKPVAAEPAPPPQVERTVARAPERPVSKVREQPGGTAQLILAVSPRGELYVDGQHRGTTPPVTTFDLEPGMHRIEVRSGSRTPYLTYMTVQAGEVRRIRYDFDTSRAVRPPGKPSWQKTERAAR